MKKFAGDIIILHMCTKNHNYMMYGSWDTEWDRQSFLLFWAIFCSFTTPTPTSALMIPKIKTLKKSEKIPGDIIRAVFYPYTPPPTPLPAFWTQKIKILKKWKKRHEVLSFYTCVP